MLIIKSLILTTAFTLSPIERPHLVIAQGLIESGMNQYAKGKAGERGAWQVIGKIWGKVPKSINEQLDQHDRIMKGLVKEHGLPDAIKRYNGAGRAADRYFAKVRKKSLELAVIGV